MQVASRARDPAAVRTDAPQCRPADESAGTGDKVYMALLATSALLLLAVALCFFPPDSAAAAHQLRVAVSGDDCPKPVCAALLGAFVKAGLVPTQIDNAALAKLSKAEFDVLVLPNAPAFPAEAAPAYFRFAQAGGHLAVLGGRPPRLNITASFASL
eukprot:SAG31_NODE_22917_length_515_cov_1.139423_1_plen_156_part_10